jgi:hypothetical protein
MVETKKVALSSRQSFFLLYSTIHLAAILAALVIVFLNFYGAWIGKELQGTISNDGQKLFALQLAAKLLELIILASLGDMITTMLLNRLAAGNPIPFAALTTGLQFQDGSRFFSREWLAICTASFRGKTAFVAVATCSTLLALTVGPASAVAMTPILDHWPAKHVHFAVNASIDELWPTNINGSYIPPTQGTAWQSIEQNLFSFWGHETMGGIFAAPEKASIPGESSVRSLEVRFKGPFRVYQPLYTAASVQMAFVADAVSNLRLPWYWSNVYGCAWARGILAGQRCTWKDISWRIRALQPVVFSKCLRSRPASPMTFPTLTFDVREPDRAASNVRIPLTALNRSALSTLEWVTLEPETFPHASVGVVVRTSGSSAEGAPEMYACSTNAQWSYANAQSTFMGGPYLVEGSPVDFFIPADKGNKYQGSQVRIEPEWATHLNYRLNRSDRTLTVFDTLMHAGRRIASAEKVEAVLAVLLAQSMASLGENAIIQGNTPDRDGVLDSVKSTAEALYSRPGYHQLTLETKIYGYAYGVRSASGVSVSSLLSVVILCFYLLVVTTFLWKKLRSKYHVNSWHTFTNLIALALNSSPGPDMTSFSAGVEKLETLRLPVTFAVNKNDSIEMVIGKRMAAVKGTYTSIERDKAYS